MTEGLASPRIVCAANLHNYSNEVAIGVRHFCPIMRTNITLFCAARGLDWSNGNDAYVEGWRTSTQGFIDQHGNFYDRKAAWSIAVAADQLYRDEDKCAGTLYSEHLY
jgi:hypothetical protein